MKMLVSGFILLTNFSSIHLMAIPSNSTGTTTATASISYQVGSVNVMSISGAPAALNIVSANVIPGSTIPNVTDNSTTYSITSNASNASVSAVLTTALPTGVSLNVSMGLPNGSNAISTAQNLSTTSQTLISGISKTVISSQSITYVLTVNVTAGVIASTLNTVTYTISGS